MAKLASAIISLLILAGCDAVPEGYPKECEVHHVRLWAERVPIEYGLILFTPWEAGNAQDVHAGGRGFPHVDEWTTGGCCQDMTGRFKSPTWEVVGYCRECRRDYHQWLEQIGGKENIKYDLAELMASRTAASEADRSAAEAWKAQQERLLKAAGTPEVANPPPAR